MVVSLLLLLVLFQAAAPPAQPPTLAAALQRMQANDNEGAARILEDIVTREPKNGRAWRNLGAVSRQLKRYDRSIEAFQRALDVDPANPGPLFQIGVVYALKGDLDRAFEWLQRAKATRKIDMTQVDVTADLGPLKKDSRFAALRPGPADFEHPFVEDVKIVREWDGEAANDQFGWIARNAGDVDGDGIADVVTSAPTARSRSGADNAGRVYVYSTKSGRLLWTADGDAANDRLGSGVEAAGDTNHDGVPDVIASAPGGDYAKVYSGRDGRVLLTLRGETRGDSFGVHASGAGDVDRDGYADLIVGAPGNGAGGASSGRADGVFGGVGRVLLTLTGEQAGDRFGSAVAGYTDTKRMLLIVGAPGGGPSHTGRAYVYDGLGTRPKFVVDSDDTGGAFGGMFLSVPGDVDGDGVPDVYVSDWQNSAKGQATGRVYVYSGTDGHRIFALTGETAGDGFGTSPSVAGDVNGDRIADLIVGAWQYSGAAIGAGRAYLYLGRSAQPAKTYTCRTPGDAFGFDAVTLGDVDGDGTQDFLITSAWSGVHGYHSGRIFIISSGVSR